MLINTVFFLPNLVVIIPTGTDKTPNHKNNEKGSKFANESLNPKSCFT